MTNFSSKFKNQISLMKIRIEKSWIKLPKCNKEIRKRIK